MKLAKIAFWILMKIWDSVYIILILIDNGNTLKLTNLEHEQYSDHKWA